MANTKPTVARQILRVPMEIVVGLYVVLDGLIAPLFGPIIRAMSRLRLIKRIETYIDTLNPYVIFVLLVVPFGIAEFTKVFAVFLMGTGHFRSGFTIFIGAYVVSILVCERTFHAGKRQLMTIPWFARLYNWVMGYKDRMLAWCRATEMWRLALALRLKARLAARRVKTRLATILG
jgi:ABC-type transport system involved in cytochrome bd biosynthesis fused ATPase/permease subunit